MSAGDPWALVRASIVALPVPVDPRLEARARLFLGELDRWNRLGRLTGYQGETARVRHLVVESLLLLRILPVPASPLLDIGTGSGVPGLVLKLARPDWDVALLEANRRRVNFLRHVLRCLELADVAVHHGRAEALAAHPGLRGGFQTVTMRAVAPPGVAAELARPFLRGAGHVVLPVGPGWEEGPGRIQEVTLSAESGALPLRRAFRIIGAAEVGADVPRGTQGARGAHPGGRQPKGRGR